MSALRGIGAFVALLESDAANVLEHTEEAGDLSSKIINELEDKQVLVYIDGIQVSGAREYFSIRLVIVTKVADPWTMWAALCNGLGADGLPMIASSIHPDYGPMSNPTLERASIILSDQASFDYTVFRTAFENLTT